jgi:hypothetical protein
MMYDIDASSSMAKATGPEGADAALMLRLANQRHRRLGAWSKSSAVLLLGDWHDAGWRAEANRFQAGLNPFC